MATDEEILERIRAAGLTGKPSDSMGVEEDLSFLAKAVGMIPRPVLTALDYAGRPYSSVVGGIYGLQQGQNPIPFALRGLTGEEYFGAFDLMVAAGADPESKLTKGVGLALDIGPGAVIDPLSYLTLGATKAGRIAKVSKTFPGRVAGAATDLWSPINVFGKPALPRGVRVGTARAFEASLGKIPSSAVVQKIRKVVGGRRHLDQKNFPNLAPYVNDQVYLRKGMSDATTAEMRNFQDLYPEEARKLMTNIWENAEFAKGGPVTVRVPQKATLEDFQKFAEEVRPGIELNAQAATAHRARFRSEAIELQGAVQDIRAGEVGLETITVSELAEGLFPESIEGGVSKGGLHYEDLLQKIVNEDNGFEVEDLLTSYLEGVGDVGEGAGRAEFVALLGVDEFRSIEDRYGHSVARVRKEAVREYKRKIKSGASGETFRFGAEFGRDIAGNAQIIYRRPGFSGLASDLQGLGGAGRPIAKRKKTALDAIDAIKRFADEGGDTIELTANYADSINEALTPAKRAAANKAWRSAIRKTGLNPNTKTAENVVGAVTDRIWSSTYAPGDYTRNLEELARHQIEEIATDPAHRYAITQKRIQTAINETGVELDDLNAGRWRPDADVPLEGFDPSDLEKSKWAMEQRERNISSLSKIRESILEREKVLRDNFDWESGAAKVDDEGAKRIQKELQALRDEEFALGVDLDEGEAAKALGGPIKEVENARRGELIQRMDELREQLYNPDPFDRQQFVKKMLEGKAGRKPRFTTPIREEVIPAREVPVSQEVLRGIDDIHVVDDASQDRFLGELQKMDPTMKSLPVENYLPHQIAKSRGVINLKNRGSSKKAVQDFERKLRVFLMTEKGFVDPKQIDDAVRQGTREFFGFDKIPGKVAGRGESELFKKRKLPFTIEEIRRSDLGFEFYDDLPYLVNKAVKTREDWITGNNIYMHMRDTLGKRQADIPADALADWVPIKYHVPFIDPAKNPYTGWFIPKQADEIAQRGLRTSREFTTDEGFRSVLDVLHYMRRHISAWTLSPFPSFDMRNLATDMQRAGMEGLSPIPKLPMFGGTRGIRSYAAAFEVLGNTTRWPTWELNHSKMFGGKAGKELVENPKAFTKFVDDIAKRWPGEDITSEKVMALFEKDEIIGGLVRDVDLRFGRGSVQPPDTRGPVQKLISRTPASIFQHVNKSEFLQVMGTKSQKINDFTRVALWIDKMKRNATIGGLSFADAVDDTVATVRRSLFDYSDLTPFEQNIGKIAFPFYTFTAKNLPFQLEKLVTSPDKFAWQVRAYNGAWNAYEGEIEPEDLPEWITNNLGIPIGKVFNTKDGREEHTVFSPNGWAPISDMAELADFIRHPIDEGGQFILSKVNPVFKEPIEQLMNTDAFTGREIDNGNIRDVLGVAMNSRTAHVLRNIRLVTEMDRLNPTFNGMFPDGIWTHMGRKLGDWKVDRPHRREAPIGWRMAQFWLGTKLYGVDVREEQGKKARGAMRAAQRARWDARRSSGEGQVAEARSNIALAMEKIQEAREASSRANELRARASADRMKREQKKGLYSAPK